MKECLASECYYCHEGLCRLPKKLAPCHAKSNADLVECEEMD